MQIPITNTEMKEKFLRDGFVVVPFLSSVQLQKLENIFKTYCSDASHNSGEVYYSVFANAPADNVVVKNMLKQTLTESYNRVFKDFTSFSEMFLVKTRDNKELMLHQDWSYTNEATDFTATVWCPLNDVTIENGTLFVVPGSHRFFRNFRSSKLPSARFAISGKLAEYVRPVNLKAGEAVIFHQALFHGSYPNSTESERVTVASIILSNRKSLSYYSPSGEDNLEEFNITEDDFINNLKQLSQGQLNADAKAVNVLTYNHKVPTINELIEKLGGKVEEIGINAL